MFIITEDWFYQQCLLDYNTGMAGKYHHNLLRSKRKRQPQWSFEKDIKNYWVTDDLSVALYECSSQFVCDRMENLVGCEFLTAEDAHDYCFAAFTYWWSNHRERTCELKNKKYSVEEMTIGSDNNNTNGVEMKVEWKDLLNKIEEFAQAGSADDAFFFEYLLMTDEEKNSYWSDDKQQVRIGNKKVKGRWVKRQTFYNHLNKFKRKLADAFNN